MQTVIRMRSGVVIILLMDEEGEKITTHSQRHACGSVLRTASLIQVCCKLSQ